MPRSMALRVIVPVADQDQALAFYVEKLGFDKRLDGESPAGRWIEVAPPGARRRLRSSPPSRTTLA